MNPPSVSAALWFGCVVLGLCPLRTAYASASDCGSEWFTTDVPSTIGALGNPARKSFVEVRELGQRIQLVGGEDLAYLAAPPRLGTALAKISDGPLLLEPAVAGSSEASAMYRYLCADSQDATARHQWFLDAARIGETLKEPDATESIDGILRSLNRLSESAPDSEAKTLSNHLVAQAQMLAGRSTQARQAFADVEQQWIELGMIDRALAARVAQTEELINRAEFNQAIEIARSFPGSPIDTSYYGVRLEAARCLALWSLRHLGKAESCYRNTLSSFDALGERLERANVALNLASMLDQDGRLDEAWTLIGSTVELPSAPGADMIRGRSRLLMAELALDRAELAEALRHLGDAIDSFDLAGAPRWRANALLVAASLYSDLGAEDEAMAFLHDAVNQIDPVEAPARIAATLSVLSGIELRKGRPMFARRWAQAAKVIYSDLEMPAEVRQATISELAALIAIGESQGMLVDVSSRLSPPFSAREKLVLAESAYAANDLGQALRLIETVEPDQLGLVDVVQWGALKVHLDPRMERESFEQTSSEVSSLVAESDNPVLRQLMSSRLRPYFGAVQAAMLGTITRDCACDLSTPTAIDGATANTLWRLATRADLDVDPIVPSERSHATTAANEEFDRLLTRELLATSENDFGRKEVPGNRLRRQLIATLSRSEPVTTAPDRSRPGTGEYFEHLEPGTLLLAYVEGTDRSAWLWVGHDLLVLTQAPDPSAFIQAVGTLTEVIGSRQSTSSEIALAIRRASDLILPVLPVDDPPVRLLVIGDEVTRRVPWAALEWNRDAPLVDTTTVSLVRTVIRPNRNVTTSGQLEVSVASPMSAYGQTSALPLIVNAAVEANLIAESTSSIDSVVKRVIATRQGVLDAFWKPGAWVHIAAHATTEPGKIGYSGLWLDGISASHPAEFLSWLDVASQQVRADVVVLNACSLAQSSSSTSRGNLNFASALSSAGANHVVAALWPVSDGAAAIWVTEFYRSVAAGKQSGNADVASFLRHAQLRLKASRAFRHPFFWASLVHFTVLPSTKH